MQVWCKFSASLVQVWCKFSASLMQVSENSQVNSQVQQGNIQGKHDIQPYFFSKQECNDDQAPCCRSFHIPKGYDQQVFTKVTTISAKFMHLRLHKFYEPKTPQIL